MKSKHLGSSFEDFLKEQGIHEAATSHALKRVIAWQLAEAMKANNFSKFEMARRMNTTAGMSKNFVERSPVNQVSDYA